MLPIMLPADRFVCNSLHAAAIPDNNWIGSELELYAFNGATKQRQAKIRFGSTFSHRMLKCVGLQCISVLITHELHA